MNKVILLGHLARDPEIATTGTGKTYARMAIAVNRRFSNKNTQGGQTVDFIPLVCWEHLADFAGKYLKKGIKILVTGRLQVRSYEAQDGTKRTISEVVVAEIEFAESKRQDKDSVAYNHDEEEPAKSLGAVQEEVPF